MGTAYLDIDQLHAIVGAMADAAMVNNSTLDALLLNIDARYAASLPEGRGGGMDRVLTTLDRLNTTGQLSSGTVPFVIWLKNAAFRAVGNPALQNILNQAIARVSAQASGSVSR